MTPSPNSLFKPGHNCDCTGMAGQATVLVDCAAYYRALHQAIAKAHHSIFVIGWDIDSRIELLRGDEAENSSLPIRFFDLIQWKARSNPNLQIYLNRWHFAAYLIPERELFSGYKWKWKSPPNMHYCLDGQVPFGASHHQKVVVVDDEIAFNGGMDVARARWDYREHYPLDKRRKDPPALGQLDMLKFGPYHDTQVVVAGELVRPLAELVRKRWQQATGREPIPVRKTQTTGQPPVWPECAKPHLYNVPAAISYTLPPFKQQLAVQQAEQMYIDLINKAERFVYMENQYFSDLNIAAIMNKRLREVPELRILLVSSYNPQGVVEAKSMWSQRYRFKQIAADGVSARFLMAYTISHVRMHAKAVRIHSKLSVIDDTHLRVGSTNINNRSMGLDTECDLIFEAQDERSRHAIALTRNDLLREHSGREIDDIERIVRHGNVREFLNDVPTSRQHLREIDDTRYADERFVNLAIRLADRRTPFF